IRITSHPTVALGDRSFGVHGNKLIGAVLLPDAGQAGLLCREMIDQRIERAERHSGRVAVLHPEVKEPDQKSGQLSRIQLKAAFDLFRRSPWKRSVHLKVGEPKLMCEIAINPFRARFQASSMEYGNHADTYSRSLRIVEPSGPELGVRLSPALEQLPVQVG